MTAYLFLNGASKLLGIPAIEMFKDGVPLMSMIGFVFLYFSVAGASAWSVDAMRGRTVRPVVTP